MLSTVTHAETEDYLRQEPIFPIPQAVEFDKVKADLGEILFFDTRLSKNNQIACASCHQLDAGGDDNMIVGISISADQHIINTPSIFNARYNLRKNWDGSAKTLADQVTMAISSNHDFNNSWNNVILKLISDEEFSENFNKSYKDGISEENLIDAIVEFEKTLITPDSKFDQDLRSEENILSEEEVEGYRAFKELGCISCHQGINIGGNLYQKFGVLDSDEKSTSLKVVHNKP